MNKETKETLKERLALAIGGAIIPVGLGALEGSIRILLAEDKNISPLISPIVGGALVGTYCIGRGLTSMAERLDFKDLRDSLSVGLGSICATGIVEYLAYLVGK